MSDGPRSSHISRKIKQGAIDVDYEESALVVNFTLEVVRAQTNLYLLQSFHLTDLFVLTISGACVCNVRR